ncbi:MAG: hypothetical protein J5J06_13690 [Phycisphaerae bacterium]|nr:hypothetical protein [Phycisphaerae bacterium]
MVKRTDEKPFRPLETSLVQAVMQGSAAVKSEPVVEQEPEVEVDPPRQLAAGEGTEANRPVHDIRPPAPRRVQRTTPSPVSPLAERMEREKRVLLTPTEERALERVVANIGAELGTSLKLSHVLRSCIRLVINAEHELVERARATGRVVRPPNGDLHAIEAFEKVIAGVLQTGIRGSRPVR